MNTASNSAAAKPSQTQPDVAGPRNGPTLASLMERFADTTAARTYLESIRWPHGTVCPHCGVVGEATRLGGKAATRGLWRCRACEKQFTVTVGTVYEDSHIPLHKWIIATHLICANKKSISSLSISRMLGIGYKSTWHMTHRIREAMGDNSTEQLTGVVEADETFVGGKAKNAHKVKGIPPKTPVLALVERGGKVIARKVTNVDESNIIPILREKIASGAVLQTDGATVYVNAGQHFAKHETVNHSGGEYVRGTAHIQTAESFNAMVKRSVMGAWHHISETHLDRYIGECAFRWNFRKVSDGDRMEASLRAVDGKRLTYRALTGQKR